MSIQPHVIKASPGRIAFIFISMVAIQFACFKFLQYSDYITPLFGIAVTVLLILFIFSIYLLWMVYQRRTPRIIFNLEDLEIIKYTAKTRIKYADITSFSLERHETNYRITAYEPERKLFLYTAQPIQVVDIFSRTTSEPILQVQQGFLISNDQILETAMLICVLCQNKAKSRPAFFHKLNNRQFRFIDFLSQKDIANFNYDQKLNKKFSLRK